MKRWAGGGVVGWVFIFISPLMVQGSWPMFRHDPRHTGRSPYAGTPLPELLWKFKVGGFVSSSPVIGRDGTVYIGTTDNLLYAIDPNGREKWRFKTGGRIVSTPAVAEDGTVYIGSGDRNFYALDPAGREKWRYDTGSPIASSPTIGDDGNIYVGSGKSLFAFSPDGRLIYKSYVAKGIISSPAVDGDGNAYFQTFWLEPHMVYALNALGRVRWSFLTGGGSSSPAIGEDNRIFVGSRDSLLYALDGATGSLIWRFKTQGWIESSPAIGGDGTVYIGSRDSSLYAVNPDGTERFRFKTGGEISLSSPAVDKNGVVYVGSADSSLYSVNPDGTLRWRFKTQGRIESSPAIGRDGTVYIGSWDGYLYALRSTPEVGESPSSSYPGAFCQILPNPFRSWTKIRFRLPVSGWMSLRIYDPCGRLVTELCQGLKASGVYEIEWDGRGSSVEGGVYFYLLEAPGFRSSGKIVLIR